MQYTTDGLMTSFTDPNFNETIFTFYDDGRLATDQDAAGSLKQIEYNQYSPIEDQTTFTTGEGLVTTYSKPSKTTAILRSQYSSPPEIQIDRQICLAL